MYVYCPLFHCYWVKDLFIIIITKLYGKEEWRYGFLLAWFLLESLRAEMSLAHDT